MKTLFISDLDGTLLNSSAELTPYAIMTLNRLIVDGMNFTVATARNEYTVKHILNELKLRLPIVLSNGCVLYDQNGSSNVKYLPRKAVERAIELATELNLGAFMYSLSGTETQVSYVPKLENPAMFQFREERRIKYNKPFIPVDDYFSIISDDVYYLTFLGEHEQLSPLSTEFETIPGVSYAFYLNNYQDDEWILELFSEFGNKSNAVKTLRSTYGFERVVGFGDNLNDLPLFAECDIGCAVGSARDEVKAAADIVIGSNLDDGVVKWLAENWEKY